MTVLPSGAGSLGFLYGVSVLVISLWADLITIKHSTFPGIQSGHRHGDFQVFLQQGLEQDVVIASN